LMMSFVVGFGVGVRDGFGVGTGGFVLV